MWLYFSHYTKNKEAAPPGAKAETAPAGVVGRVWWPGPDDGSQKPTSAARRRPWVNYPPDLRVIFEEVKMIVYYGAICNTLASREYKFRRAFIKLYNCPPEFWHPDIRLEKLLEKLGIIKSRHITGDFCGDDGVLTAKGLAMYWTAKKHNMIIKLDYKKYERMANDGII